MEYIDGGSETIKHGPVLSSDVLDFCRSLSHLSVNGPIADPEGFELEGISCLIY